MVGEEEGRGRGIQRFLAQATSSSVRHSFPETLPGCAQLGGQKWQAWPGWDALGPAEGASLKSASFGIHL